MRRVIGIDVHRTFGEVVIWQNGLTRHEGRVEMTRTALEGFGRQLLKTDGVVVEPTGNAMAVLRVLTPFVARVVIANPLQVKAIAHAHVKTDKAWAGTLASLHAAGHLPEIWTPDAATGRRRRLVARRGAALPARPAPDTASGRGPRDPGRAPDPEVPARPFCSAGAGGWGWRASPCPTTSAWPSTGTCASSTGSGKIWPSSTARPRSA